MAEAGRVGRRAPRMGRLVAAIGIGSVLLLAGCGNDDGAGVRSEGSASGRGPGRGRARGPGRGWPTRT
jgi:hypothetical protein